MGLHQRIVWEPLRSIDSATFTGVYVPIGGVFTFPIYKIKLVNTSNVLVTISMDGVNDHDVAPANSFWLYDETQTNTISDGPALPKNLQMYVKGSAGTGLVYLVTQYILT